MPLCGYIWMFCSPRGRNPENLPQNPTNPPGTRAKKTFLIPETTFLRAKKTFFVLKKVFFGTKKPFSKAKKGFFKVEIIFGGGETGGTALEKDFSVSQKGSNGTISMGGRPEKPVLRTKKTISKAEQGFSRPKKTGA